MRTRLTAPVVLAHGLFGFERIGLGPLTLATYFRGIPELLRAMGNRVLVSQVHPTGGIQRRARDLGERILAAFPDEPVHIIGHSMGGLDTRELLTDPAWSGRVLSVTTISTPHLGSTMADLARRSFGPVYQFLKAIGWDHEGFLDLIPDRAVRWHERTQAPEGIPCFSVAGDPPESEVCWPLQRLFALMSRREGPNDGLVSVASASAFGRPLPAWPTDHLQQMNWWTGYPRLRVPPNIAAAYASVVENMALCERAPEYAERH